MHVDADYYKHWDAKFSARDWGRYPPEDFVRFMGRNFKSTQRENISVLEVGCGPGANIWFLHREGYKVSGIDGSSAAIEKARIRIENENANLNETKPDLQVGNFASLPWGNNHFDVVVDIYAIYANTVDVIDETLNEVYRVLKPGGRFYSKLWGTKTTGFGQGKQVEPHSYDEIPCGPCYDMGVSHFFDIDEIRQRFGQYQIDAIDTIIRSDSIIDSDIEEFLCQFTKPLNK